MQGASGLRVSKQGTEQKSLTKRLWNNQTEVYNQALPYRQENHCSFTLTTIHLFSFLFEPWNIF